MTNDLVGSALFPAPPIPPARPDLVVPVLVAQLGDAAAWHYVEFFTTHIRNPNTRRADARACGRFLS